MKHFLLLVLLYVNFSAYAQNYRVFQFGIPHFYYSQNDIRAIKVDSATLSGADSVFYNFFSIDEFNPDTNGCYNLFGPSWIGQKIILFSDSLTVLFTYDNDSIFIRPLESVGSSWNLMTLDSNRNIQADVTGITSMIINGSPDSVKTIMLSEVVAGVPVSSAVNGKEIKLSKNHGFFQLLPFRDFPGDVTEYSLDDSLQLTWRNVHEFDVGDSMQFTYYIVPPGTWQTPPFNYDLFVVTSKTYSPTGDYVTYDFAKQNIINAVVFDSTGYHMVSTVTNSVTSNSYQVNDSLILPTMPEETDTTGGVVNRYYMSKMFCNSVPGIRTEQGGYFYDAQFGCYQMYLEPVITEYGWAKGLGFITNSTYGCTLCGDYSFIRYLSSFHKANQQCGSIQLPTAIIDPQHPGIKIYPNPVSENGYFFIENIQNEKAFFELFDVCGKSLLRKNLTETVTLIDVSTFPQGCYFYKLTFNDKSVLSEKILK